MKISLIRAKLFRNGGQLNWKTESCKKLRWRLCTVNWLEIWDNVCSDTTGFFMGVFLNFNHYPKFIRKKVGKVTGKVREKVHNCCDRKGKKLFALRHKIRIMTCAPLRLCITRACHALPFYALRVGHPWNGRFRGGLPTGRAVCSHVLPPWTHQGVRLCRGRRSCFGSEKVFLILETTCNLSLFHDVGRFARSRCCLRVAHYDPKCLLSDENNLYYYRYISEAVLGLI
jgi:hypothetical protein